MILLTSALEVKPALCLGGFHRIDLIDHHLMDVVASRAFECPDVKTGRAGRDSSQHRRRFTLRTWWSRNMEHDASLGLGESAVVLSVTGGCRHRAVIRQA
jgi:hypothetical protein